MVYPSSDEVENKVGSRYSLVIAVAKRAKQLKEGAPKLIDCKSRNPITIALEEIASGKLKIVIPTPEEVIAASRRREIPATRPVARTTAELLRVPAEFEVEEVVEATPLAVAVADDVEETDELEDQLLSADTDEDPVALDEREESPFVDENMGAIESEE